MPRLPGPMLRTPRLILQTPRMRDVTDLFRWTRDPAITRYMSWNSPDNRRVTEQFVQESARNQRAGRGLVYVLHDAETGRPIGACGAHEMDTETHLKAEFGYWIARPYWGQGLVPEAMGAFLPHLFLTVGLHRLSAFVFVKNARSAHVLTGLGFRLEGTLRHNIRKNDRYIDVLHYAMLSTDPAARALIRRAGR